jgi:hypothetical protein
MITSANPTATMKMSATTDITATEAVTETAP